MTGCSVASLDCLLNRLMADLHYGSNLQRGRYGPDISNPNQPLSRLKLLNLRDWVS